MANWRESPPKPVVWVAGLIVFESLWAPMAAAWLLGIVAWADIQPFILLFAGLISGILAPSPLGGAGSVRERRVSDG